MDPLRCNAEHLYSPASAGLFLVVHPIYDHPDHALYQGPFRCHRPGYLADAAQVAPRSQGLVQDSLSRLAYPRDRGERVEAGSSAYGAATEGA